MSVSEQVPVEIDSAVFGRMRLFLALYRELHDRAEGKPCMCGVCQMVRDKPPTRLDLPDVKGHPQFDAAMKALEMARQDSI